MPIALAIVAFLCTFFGWLTPRAAAQEAQPESPYWRLLTFPLRAVEDVPEFLKAADPRQQWSNYASITASTLALWYYDQKIIDGSQHFARHVGLISPHDDGRQTDQIAKPVIFGVGAPINLPKTPNTIMYYFGDGLTSFLIAGGLTTYSLATNDARSLGAATDVLEAITLAGTFVLPLKMATGRESPFRHSEDRGVWRGFVGFKNYLSDVSKHDAYPSGHIATLSATVRVLAETYMEKSWILPVGYTAMGLLMFAMLNNGVHWASDYPLGIAIGFTAAGTVMAHRHAESSSAAATITHGLSLVHGDRGGVGIQKTWEF